METGIADAISAARTRLRVVHLISGLNVGGMEKVVLDLARFANREILDIHVLCLGEVGALGSEFLALNVPVEGLDVLGRGLLSAVQVVRKRLRVLRPEILHTHNPSPHLIGVVAAIGAGVPHVIHTKHGRNYPQMRVRVLLNRFASWLTDRIVAVSEDAAKVAREIEKVNSLKVLVIRNGIDLAAFKAPSGRMADKVLSAVHVARLIYPTKDQRTLLRAAKIVVDAEPGFRLDIVGDGPDRAVLEALRDELKLQAHVVFHGLRNDVSQFLARAGMFVLSSVEEGLPLTLLEAMAASLPIVATRVGGIPEVVDDGTTGLLVPHEAPEALAHGILTLLRDPQGAIQMGLAGRQRAAEHFDVRVMVARYEKLYLAVARG